MTWSGCSGAYLDRSAGKPALVYADPAGWSVGSLLLWLDPAGIVERFELCHAPAPGRREYVAGWRRGGRLRVGEVEGERADDDRGPRIKMSPIIRGSRRPSGEILGDLRAYFEREAGSLEAAHREQIGSVLEETAG
jgi:hypothetical protein